VASEIFADLLTESSPGVVHGQNNAENGEGGVESALFNPLDQIEDLSDSFESEVFALDGHENLFCSDEGAGHEEANAGRAVEDDEIKSGIESKGIEGFADSEQWVFQSGQLDFRTRKIQFRGENLQVGVAGRLQHVGSLGLPKKDGVEAFSGSMLESETAGGIGLGIEVDEENATACLGRPCSQMNGGGSLSHPPFLIHNGNYAHTQGKRG